MGNRDKYVTHEEAAKIMCYALSKWKITYHYPTRHAKDSERAELNLEDPENGDVMEVVFYNDKIWEIVVTTDTEIVAYYVKEDSNE